MTRCYGKLKTKNIATFYVILAAMLYAINVPLSKLLNYAEPTMMASFLYIGAGVCLFFYGLYILNVFRGKGLRNFNTRGGM